MRTSASLASLLAQRLDEAKDRRQRRTQFVAGVGNEIDPHPLGRVVAGLVDKVDDSLAVRRLAEQHLPALIPRAEPDQLDRSLAVDRPRRAQALGRGRMADRNARVLAKDMRAEQRPRGTIGDHDAAVLDQHHRCDDRIEHVVEH